VDDVAAAVDWKKITDSLDSLMSKPSWGLKLKYTSISVGVPLEAQGATKLLLRSAMKGAEESSLSSCQIDLGPSFVINSHIILQDADGKGRGWFAKENIPPGTIVLLERPLVAVLDTEYNDQPWGFCSSADSAALSIELAKCFSQSLQDLLSDMHPRKLSQIVASDDINSDEDDDEAAAQALDEAVPEAWSQVDGIDEPTMMRLKQVVKLNSLGFYTNSEQICHHNTFSCMTGTGLFALGSGFNHSCDPNVARLSFGDITAFVTSCSVDVGAELCISYIESELLCAPISLRRQSLNRDFICSCRKCLAESSDQGSEATNSNRYLHVNSQVQAELSSLPPAERVEAVDAALRGEMGDDDEENGESEEESGSPILLGKDSQELRVVQAVALMQLQEYRRAIGVWRQLAAFACFHCPKFDESLAVYATQAALCAIACNDESAPAYVSRALVAHRISSGVSLYRWRFAKEVEQSPVDKSTTQEFWDITKTTAEQPVTWNDFVAGWDFKPEEIPAATTEPKT